MPSKNRLEAFSDGVFAIVITLLVIEIHPPDVSAHGSLARALWHQWPSYVGYLASANHFNQVQKNQEMAREYGIR